MAVVAIKQGYRIRLKRRLRFAIPVASVVVLAVAFALPAALRVLQIGDITPTGPGQRRVETTPAPSDPRTDPGAQGLPKGAGGGAVGGPVAGIPGVGEAPVAASSGTRVAFVSTRDGNTEIYTMDADGGDQQRLTNSVSADESPTWSPDGSRIAFASNRSGDYGIYTMRADGSDVRRIGGVDGEQALSPAWSPDGQRFAFVSYEDKARTQRHWIWIMSVDGSARRALTYGGNELSPAWSPDGRRIAYWDAGRISVIEADGSNRELIENGTSPAWSPDGRHIAFIKVTDDFKRQALVVMDSDGTKPRTLFESTDEWLGHPSWAPDGVIAFDRDPDGHGFAVPCGIAEVSPDCIGYGPDPSAIWLIGTDGKDLRRLPGSTDDYDATFSWAPR